METKFPTRFQSGKIWKQIFRKHQNFINKYSKMAWLYFNEKGCSREKISTHIKKTMGNPKMTTSKIHHENKSSYVPLKS